jgi:hypothetical protein
LSSTRPDETWHRLREWTSGQTPSERLAAQLLIHEGFTSLDPSHPLGGRDGGKDALCIKGGKRWVMAVYFPRAQCSFSEIRKKFLDDLAGACAHEVQGIAFVTNQELALAERKSMSEASESLEIDLYHLERITAILDSPAMAVIRKQFLDIDYEDKPSVILGGQGGNAPGAGGGGGGAMGLGAQGGPGGPGGKVIFEGRPGIAPGAGGGGVGVLGDTRRGGQGGGGGDQIQAMIGPEELAQLKQAGFHHVEFQVGQGGISGGPGEDTIVNFVTEDGTVLKTILAKGGKPGMPAEEPFPGREATPLDVELGLRVTTVTLAECGQIKDGLLNLLGAGWENFKFATLPFEANWPLAITVDLGSTEPGATLAFHVVVKDPAGFQVLKQPFSITRQKTGPVSRPNILIPIAFTGSQTGVWTIEITSGAIVFAKHPIEIIGPQKTRP